MPIVAAALLVGCTPLVSGSLLPDVSFPTPTPGDGAALFALQVAVDSSSDNPVSGEYLTFESVQPQVQKRFAVFDLKDQRVFLVSLPPGTYATYFEVYAWERLADGRAGVKVPAPAAFAAFEVKPGAVTVVGALRCAASVTRQRITTNLELDPTMGTSELVGLALGRPEAQQRGWSTALQGSLGPAPSGPRQGR